MMGQKQRAEGTQAAAQRRADHEGRQNDAARNGRRGGEAAGQQFGQTDAQRHAEHVFARQRRIHGFKAQTHDLRKRYCQQAGDQTGQGDTQADPDLAEQRHECSAQPGEAGADDAQHHADDGQIRQLHGGEAAVISQQTRMGVGERERHQRAGHRGEDDGGKAGDGVFHHHHFHGENHRGQRGVERGRDTRCGAAADQCAHAIVGQSELAAEPAAGGCSDMRRRAFAADRLAAGNGQCRHRELGDRGLDRQHALVVDQPFDDMHDAVAGRLDYPFRYQAQ